MNKTTLTFALFFGVFAVAYGSFFYHEYSERQQPIEPVATTDAQKLLRDTTAPKHLQPPQAPAESSTDTVESKDESPPSNSSTAKSSKTRQPVAQRTQTRQSSTPLTSERASVTTTTNLPVTGTDVVFNNSQFQSPTAVVTSTESSATTSQVFDNTLTTPLSSPAPTPDPATSTVPSDDDDKANSESAEENLYATPNCLFRLPDGSTEADAENMKTAYGCRYRNSCTNRNDGSGTYACHWAYIR